mgnify:CR=1 FL=1
MAAFDFPSSPNNGDTYSANGIDWIYNGSVWKKDATAGVKGQKGEVGVTGDKGQKGEKGEVGPQGDKGQKGEIGATGGSGGTGSQGDKGQKGEVGAAATKGQKGEIGATGGSGGTGNAGSDGDKGQKGEIGTTGTVFTSGTRMLFNQTSAPTGWTKDTSSTNRALRLVSGTVGTGGGNTFTGQLNASVTTTGGDVSNHTLTTAQLPAHFHNVWTRNERNIDGSRGTSNQNLSLIHISEPTRLRRISYAGSDSYTPTSENTGSSSAHNHGFTNPSFNLNLAYTDVIIAQKD